jgi:acyl carrier protein
MSIESEIERFVLNELLYGGGPSELAIDEPLISSGLLDSMDLLRLIAYLEEHYGVAVEEGDLIPENFETLHFIGSYVERKLNGGKRVNG